MKSEYTIELKHASQPYKASLFLQIDCNSSTLLTVTLPVLYLVEIYQTSYDLYSHEQVNKSKYTKIKFELTSWRSWSVDI